MKMRDLLFPKRRVPRRTTHVSESASPKKGGRSQLSRLYSVLSK
jgi:hypothetical protein